MGLALFEHGAVVHDRAGKIGQILPSEEGQRQAAQFFGQSGTAHARFHIGGEIGAVVLQSRGGGDKKQTARAGERVEQSPLRGDPGGKVAHEGEKQPGGGHEGDVLKRLRQTGSDERTRSPFGKGETAL